MKKKYYRVFWPDSQKFMENKECIQSEDMTYFVPCEIYDEVMKL